MSNYVEGKQTEEQAVFEISGEENAFRILFEATAELKRSSDVSQMARTSFDQQRSKAAFFLNGEVLSEHATDTGDTPFPEMDGVFSTEMSRINTVKFGIESLVSYYLGNLDTEVVETQQ